MKRKLTFYGGYFLILFMLAAACIACCTSCNKLRMIQSEVIDKEYADSIIAESIQNYTNPLFSSVEEALEFRSLTIDAQIIDNEFLEMPEDILRNVTSVCLKRDGYASKRSIIYEYRANAEVYNNLPKSQNGTSSEVDTSNVQKGTSAGGEPYRDSIKTKDTINLNGKKYVSHE